MSWLAWTKTCQGLNPLQPPAARCGDVIKTPRQSSWSMHLGGIFAVPLFSQRKAAASCLSPAASLKPKSSRQRDLPLHEHGPPAASSGIDWDYGIYFPSSGGPGFTQFAALYLFF